MPWTLRRPGVGGPAKMTAGPTVRIVLSLLVIFASAPALLGTAHAIFGWLPYSSITFRENAAAAFVDVDEAIIYISHGRNVTTGEDTALLHKLDVIPDRWTALPSAAVPRSQLVGASVLDTKYYAIGGRSTSPLCPSGVCDVVEVFDIVTQTWSMGPPMPTARAGMGAAGVGPLIYVFGGRQCPETACGTPLAAVEILDTVTNRWSSGPPMPTPRMDVYSVVPVGNLIFVIGGYNAALGGDLAVVEVLDAATLTWVSFPPITVARSNAIAGWCDDHVYVIGGTIDGVETDSVEEFHFETFRWQAGPTMPRPGSGFAAGYPSMNSSCPT